MLVEHPAIVALLKAVVILLVTGFTAYVVRKAFGSALSHSDARIISPVLLMASLLVWVTGTLIAVGTLGVPIEAILAVFAAIAFAFGLGMARPLENLLARSLIDMFSGMGKGRTLVIDGIKGVITDINALYTVILRDDNSLLFIPNSRFLREGFAVELAKSGQEMMLQEKVPVGIDLSRLESAVLGQLKRIPGIVRKPGPLVALSGTGRGTQEISMVFNISDLGQRAEIIRKVRRAFRKCIEDVS